MLESKKLHLLSASLKHSTSRKPLSDHISLKPTKSANTNNTEPKLKARGFSTEREREKVNVCGRSFEHSMHSVDIRIPFSSAREAEIACGTLTVDKEPKRTVQKTISVDDKCLIVSFEAIDIRTLRVSVNSFFDYMKLIAQTMQAFGPPR